MRTQQLATPKTIDCTLKIKDFRPYTKLSTYCIVGQEIKSPTHSFRNWKTAPSGAQNVYYVSNRLFAYSSDTYIYEYLSNKFTKLEICKSQPYLVPVMIDGIEEILVVSNSESFILGKSQNKFTLPFGNYYTTYNNRLFIAKNRNIYFSDVFDANNLTMDISNSGYVSVSNQDGDIVGLENYDGNLYVFCQKAIYILHISLDNNFTFTKCNTCEIDIKPDSVVRVCDEFVFLSRKRICTFKNSKVEYLNLMFENEISTTTFKATKHNEYYVLPFKVGSISYLFMFDTINRSSHVLNGAEGGFVGDRYLFVKSSRYIYEINDNIRQTFNWTSDNTNLGTHSKKMIMEVGIYSSSDAIFYVYSKEGHRYFSLKRGTNQYKMNLVGDEFHFSVLPSSNTTIVKDLQIKYRIIGD